MISASHNPYQDNGLKVFSRTGFKLPDEEEHAVEQEIFALLDKGVTPQPATLAVDPSLARRYFDYLVSTMHARLDGVRLAIDCGNGASYTMVPELLRSLGAEGGGILLQSDRGNL